MKCEELLALLNDYVDGGLEPGLCEEFERYMAGCNPCKVVVDNIRQTITLYRNEEPLALPLDFQSRLQQSIRERWKAHPPAATRSPSPDAPPTPQD